LIFSLYNANITKITFLIVLYINAIYANVIIPDSTLAEDIPTIYGIALYSLFYSFHIKLILYTLTEILKEKDNICL